MPLYEYECEVCDFQFDHFHKSISNLDEVNCPVCGSDCIKKLISTFKTRVVSEAHLNYRKGMEEKAYAYKDKVLADRKKGKVRSHEPGELPRKW